MNHTMSYMLYAGLRYKPKNVLLTRFDVANKILDTVCAFYGVSKDLVLGGRRDRPICMCRHVTCYLLRNHTDLKLKEIGKLLGERDHTTIMNSVRVMWGWLRTEDELSDQVKRIETILAQLSLKRNVAATSISEMELVGL